MTQEHTLNLGTQMAPASDTSWKKGTRVLGVAESFEKDARNSFVVGVIMRGDLRIDGAGLCQPTVGGLDSTDELLDMYRRLARPDIRAWMISGSVISWFNVVDLKRIHEMSEIPVICISYEESDGISQYVREYFPDDWHKRMELVKSNGIRVPATLSNGYDVFLNIFGVSVREAQSLLDLFTLDGRVPEVIRVARVLASGIRRDIRSLRMN